MLDRAWILAPTIWWPRAYTQESNDNYIAGNLLLDVYRGGKKQFQLAPQARLYQTSQNVQTMVANHSTPLWDLYVVFEGQNQDSGLPAIKAFLNPLVMWIWIGAIISSSARSSRSRRASARVKRSHSMRVEP